MDSPLITPPPATADLDVLLDLLRDRLAPPAELLDRVALAALLSVGASTLDRLRETGAIGPKPIRLGGALRWYRGEVLAWLANRDSSGELHGARSWASAWDAIRRRNAAK